MATTGLGVGGPIRSYGTFTAKETAAIAAQRITGMYVGGPGVYYGTFTDKAEADPSALAGFNYPIYCRARKRR